MRAQRLLPVLVCSFIGAALLAVPAAAQAQGVLDGRGFSVTSTNPEEPFPDHLAFVAGTFESMGCRPFGFGPAPYTTTDEGGAVTFQATTTSAGEGSMAWVGTLAADGLTISGTYTWSKEGQEPITASWAGTAANGPLDGRVYSVTAERDAPADQLTFLAGAFESVECRPYGFYPIAYQATANADGSIAWTATSYSFTEGQMAWTGTVTGDQIEGSYTWTKEGQDPQTERFAGHFLTPPTAPAP